MKILENIEQEGYFQVPVVNGFSLGFGLERLFVEQLQSI